MFNFNKIFIIFKEFFSSPCTEFVPYDKKYKKYSPFKRIFLFPSHKYCDPCNDVECMTNREYGYIFYCHNCGKILNTE